MKAIYYVTVGLLATIGGILGNLIASAIEHTVGDFYTIQAIAGMLLGIFIVLIISYQLLEKEDRNDQHSKEIVQLQDELEFNRQELKRLKHYHESGAHWKEADIRTWQEHQRIIDKLKQVLAANKVSFSFDPIDNAPPPPLPILQRFISSIGHITSIFVWPFIIAIVLSLILSPAAHLTYLEYIVPPEPTPSPVFTPESTPTPTLEVTSLQEDVNATNASIGALESNPRGTPSTIAAPLFTPTSGEPPAPLVPNLVLWDISHYQDTQRAVEDGIDLYWHEKYSSIKVALVNRGMQNIISDQGVLNHNLPEYGLVIINLAWCWDEPYSEQEATSLLKYVQGGGSLVIMGDHLGTPNENLSPITNKLGVETGGSWSVGTNEDGIEHLTVFSDHDIFAGVTDIIIDYWSGELILNNETDIVALGQNDEGQVAIAALEIGTGKIIVLGDMAMWHDTEIGSAINNAQNYLFAINALDWMLANSE